MGEEKITTTQAEDASEPSAAEKKIAGGAAVAGGIVGAILAGPMVGAAAALGCGALALNKNYVGSEAAQSTGKAIVSTGEKIDNDYQVVEKTKTVGSTVVTKANDFNNK